MEPWKHSMGYACESCKNWKQVNADKLCEQCYNLMKEKVEAEEVKTVSERILQEVFG